MAEPLKLRVRNFLGVSKADLDLSAIFLVAGVNAAGKSSLCEALASAVCSSPLARGQTSKKAAASLLRNGTDKGSISLDYGPGSIRITYPSCEIEQAGKPASLGTPLGIGSARLMALTLEQRARQIGERFKTQPTIADLREWTKEHPDAGVSTEELLTILWNDIDVQGWDSMHKTALEHGTKLKGRWEAVTSTKWGSKIAKNWCPSPLLPGEEYDLEAARATAAAAQVKLEELVGHAAVAQADVARIEEQSVGLDKAKEEYDAAQAEGVALSKQHAELVAKRAKSPAPVDPKLLPSCPHCGERVVILTDDKERYHAWLEKAPASLPADKLAKAVADRRELDENISLLQRKVKENATRSTTAAGEVKACERARTQLLDVQSRPRIADQEVENARSQALDAKRKADAIEAAQKATAIYDDWTQHQVLIEGLSPDGVRRGVMARKLSSINTTLGEFSATAKFSDVVLTDDLDCTYDGRPYVLLSESERWRCDLVLTCALAQQEVARVIIADRFDVLNPQARPGALMLLRSVGIPALVCMTAKDAAAVPDLTRAKFGTTRWLDHGVLEAIVSAAAAA